MNRGMGRGPIPPKVDDTAGKSAYGTEDIVTAGRVPNLFTTVSIFLVGEL
jgi:hypothetical protein